MSKIFNKSVVYFIFGGIGGVISVLFGFIPCVIYNILMLIALQSFYKGKKK